MKADPAYEILAELQRALLVDRGPFEARAAGVPYLSKDGYPYRLVHLAHPDLVNQAKKLTEIRAAATFLQRYLDGATFCHVRKMESMFKQCLHADEIDAAITMLARKGALTLAGNGRGRIVGVGSMSGAARPNPPKSAL